MNAATPPPAKPMNQSPGGLASNAPKERHYTPSEFSAALAEYGISVCTDRIRLRCLLHAADPQHISTNPAFPGRHYIPESELIRLVTARRHE
jgi:hypothetical protein